ncbi:flavodoxin [Treponema sp.]|uniref:flavodoxin n=1 Tax=Treponema sp. TaxID=166 RepID=UPI00298E49FC|nr:flavodoxin [Treponema sp.]MCR5613014.1 flavodoxin [Treponema sp.]
MNVSIVYASTTGNTQAMAEAINSAISAAGASVTLTTADSADKDAVLASDVILLGSPAMGDEVLEDSVEAFFTQIEGSLKGKKVGIFGSYDWGDGQWLRDWDDRLNSLGAVRAGEPLMVHLTPEAADIDNCTSWAKAVIS